MIYSSLKAEIKGANLKLKKVKVWCFYTAGETKGTGLQKVLHTVGENTSREHLKHSGSGWSALSMEERTISKRMEATFKSIEQYKFLKPSLICF